MRRTLLGLSVAALLLVGLADFSLAEGPGKGKPEVHQSKKQVKPQAQKRMEQQSQKKRDDAKGDAEREERRIRDEKARMGDAAGAEQKAEMQERRQERKQIQEEYQEARKSGDTEKVKGKKPWWKFWASGNDAG